MLVRSLIVAAALSLLGATSALAATPPTLTGNVTGAGTASFTWTNGPTGEVVRSITYSTAPGLTADGDLASVTGGGFLSELQTVGTSVDDRVLYAGTYYYVGYWRVEDFSARGYTPLQSFAVPTSLVMGPQSITQYSSIPAVGVTGSLVTNAKVVVATCSIYNGFRLISTQKRIINYTLPRTSTKVYCSNLKVPEKLDGRKLKLVIKASGGGKAASKVSYFRAK